MSMSVSVVLVRSQPSGFTMSICSVKGSGAAPAKQRVTLEHRQAVSDAVLHAAFLRPSNVSRISAGVCAGSIVSIVL